MDKVTVKTKLLKCKLCKKKDGLVKFYLLKNALKISPYHPACFRKLINKL